VTHSLAAGLPVVTTTIGAEGLEVEDGRELLIADDPDEFAERIVRLHSDPTLWWSLSGEGQRLAERVCSPAAQKNALRSLLEVRRESPSAARSSVRPS
jgi:glycosyltransferase involved in cell wall biosynthesis